jgi:4-hydroxy-tetrahydrodipicolinate synthase
MPGIPRGSVTPLVTPFRNGALDFDALATLIEAQVSGGSHGVVVAGTSGEPGTLSLEEREQLAERAIAVAAGRVPVVVGTGTADLRSTLRLTQHAEVAGASAILVVTPYYLRPSQHGLVDYYTEVARSTALPVVLYDIPMRTGVALSVDTIAELAQIDNIVGVKETRSDLEHVSQVIARCGPDFAVYCGLETLCLPMLALGSAGHVSATGNVAPTLLAELADAAFAGEWETARALHYELLELNEAVFADTNPVPVKTMLADMGLIDPEVRSPLAPLLPEVRDNVLAAFRRFQHVSSAV